MYKCFASNRLRIDLLRRSVKVNGEPVLLRNKEFDLLVYFFKNPRKVLRRLDILEEVWDHNIFCQTNTLDVHVSALRRKLKPYLKKELIKTIHSVGYIFDV